jgi:hypothetical protein
MHFVRFKCAFCYIMCFECACIRVTLFDLSFNVFIHHTFALF